MTWSKSFGQLPQRRVQSNNSALTIFDVRKSDSDNYMCTAFNILGSVKQRTILIVFPLPMFIVRPPVILEAIVGETLNLNCSAVGNPKPVISWKREGARLPDGCSLDSKDSLI